MDENCNASLFLGFIGDIKKKTNVFYVDMIK